MSAPTGVGAPGTADPEGVASAPAAEGPGGLEETPWVTARPTRAIEIVRRLIDLPRLVYEKRDLVTTSARRDLEIRFRGTLLGWLWPLVHPLFLFVVYYFIFTKLLNFKIPNLPQGAEAALGVYMFCGIMAWSSIADGLTRGTSVIVDSGNLIKKIAFPSEILPLNITLVSMTTMAFALVVFVLACLLTPIWPAPGIELVWVPVLLFVQSVFLFGLVLLLSTLQVFLRDTLQFVGVLTTVWMFLTPLFWVPEMMGEQIEAYMPLIKGNPVYHLVMAWRGVLMGDLVVEGGGRVYDVISTAAIGSHLVVFAWWALLAYVLGYTVFILSQRRFADEV